MTDTTYNYQPAKEILDKTWELIITIMKLKNTTEGEIEHREMRMKELCRFCIKYDIEVEEIRAIIYRRTPKSTIKKYAQRMIDNFKEFMKIYNSFF